MFVTYVKLIDYFQISAVIFTLLCLEGDSLEKLKQFLNMRIDLGKESCRGRIDSLTVSSLGLLRNLSNRMVLQSVFLRSLLGYP